jgi:hypothetical protein
MSREVTAVVQTVREKEGAGFYVRRPMPTEKVNSVDPFLLLDHFGPDTHVRQLPVFIVFRLQGKQKVHQTIHIVELKRSHTFFKDLGNTKTRLDPQVFYYQEVSCGYRSNTSRCSMDD